jgi:DNA gyrase/topoisomerase IV subunit A
MFGSSGVVGSKGGVDITKTTRAAGRFVALAVQCITQVVVGAVVRILAELLEHVRGPDFPSGGELITPAADLRQMYDTGHGSLRMRAVFGEESGNIVITELPYQTSGAKIIEQIAGQMTAKKLPMLEDIRDESDHERGKSIPTSS